MGTKSDVRSIFNAKFWSIFKVGANDLSASGGPFIIRILASCSTSDERNRRLHDTAERGACCVPLAGSLLGADQGPLRFILGSAKLFPAVDPSKYTDGVASDTVVARLCCRHADAWR